MEAIGEVLIAIVAGFVELVFHLLTAVFALIGLSAMSAGMVRIIFGIGAVAGLYLLFVFLAPMVFDFYWIYETWLTNIWVLAAVLLVMVFAFSAPIAAARSDAVTVSSNALPDWAIFMSARALALATMIVLFGIVSVSGTTYKRHKTLRDRACDAAHAQFDKHLGDHKENIAALADRFLKPDIRSKVPCQKAPVE